MRSKILVTCFLLLMGTTGVARASILVYPMSTTLSSGESGIGKLLVYSKSNAVQYVKVYVKKVMSPATPQEHDVDTSPVDGVDLVASPQRILLAPGSTHVVRLVVQQRPTFETVYRVYVEPIAPPLQPDVAPASGNSQSVVPQVGISLVWGALVYVEPLHPHATFALTADGKRIQNTGNMRVSLMRAGRCTAKDSDSACQWVKVERGFYPQQFFDLPSSQNGVSAAIVRAQYRIGNDAPLIDWVSDICLPSAACDASLPVTPALGNAGDR